MNRFSKLFGLISYDCQPVQELSDRLADIEVVEKFEQKTNAYWETKRFILGDEMIYLGIINLNLFGQNIRKKEDMIHASEYIIVYEDNHSADHYHYKGKSIEMCIDMIKHLMTS